jgi:micrococcal nuclease
MLWRRRLLVAALVLAGLAAGSCFVEHPSTAPVVGTALGQVTVLDGDTLRLADGRRVRLAAVDAPELGRPFASEARDFAAARIAHGTLQLVPADPPKDRYGRLLADVLVEGESLSEALLAAGLVILYDEDAPRLVALQAHAVETRVGMHSRLDRAEGPFLLTAHRFHRPDCPFANGPQTVPCATAAEALSTGRSPCRTCLPWPP